MTVLSLCLQILGAGILDSYIHFILEFSLNVFFHIEMSSSLQAITLHCHGFLWVIEVNWNTCWLVELTCLVGCVV